MKKIEVYIKVECGGILKCIKTSTLLNDLEYNVIATSQSFYKEHIKVICKILNVSNEISDSIFLNAPMSKFDFLNVDFDSIDFDGIRSRIKKENDTLIDKCVEKIISENEEIFKFEKIKLPSFELEFYTFYEEEFGDLFIFEEHGNDLDYISFIND